MRILTAVLSFLLCFYFASEEDSRAEVPKDMIRTGNILKLTIEKNQYQFEICTPYMVRIRMAGPNGFDENEQWMVNRYQWDEVSFSVTRVKNAIEIKTSGLTVKIQCNPFGISFYNLNGELINKDVASGGGMAYHSESPSCLKELQPGEHFFGFGERMDFMDQLGKQFKLDVGRGTAKDHETGAYNILEANYSPVPFMVSTRGYGIFFHNANPSNWDMGYSSAKNYSFSAMGGELDYYFIYGPTFKQIIQQYTSLTGTSPLLPRSAMGLHVGTYSGGGWGYEDITSQYYVVALAKRFRELGIPVDVLHIDSTWRIFGKTNGKGGTSFEWRQSGFPDPKAMFDSLYALHYQMVGLHIRPRIDNGNIKNYLDIARDKGFTYPEKGKPGDFPNFFDQKAVDWWWDNCMKPLADLGCMFVKTDEGSAFGHIGNELVSKTGPQGKEIASLHNLFPIAYAKAPFLKFQEYNHIRGLEHTREGFAGIQRYPFIFAGDWPSLWQYFKPVIRAGLNIGLSGVPTWGHCMGGFEQVADPELYIRWCQFGMFSPIALLFGNEHPTYKEPWSYGPEILSIFTKYDKLRYRLIPYLYSSYYHSYLTGWPVIQALVFNYPDDLNTYNIDDQYFFGDQLLVCPVTEKGAKTRTLYLPEGEWTDYWSGERYTGKKYIITKTPLDKLPIFVKAGAIITMQPDMQYSNQNPINLVALDVYPSGSSSTKFYEDDGLSLGYQKGEFAQTEITANETSESVILEILASKGNYVVADRNYNFHVHLDKKPTAVSSSDRLLTDWTYNQGKKLLELTLFKKANEKIDVRVTKDLSNN
jgi:alpha-glucosidase